MARRITALAGVFLVAGVAVGTYAASGLAPVYADGGFAPGVGRPFASSSPLNVPIPSSPKLDPNNTALVKVLAGGSHAAAIEQYGLTIYDATASTPRRAVPCTEQWGVCPTATPVPVPVGAWATPGTDGAMAVIDWTTRQVYEYWQYRGTSTSWSTVSSIDGTGTAGGAVGAGISRLAGVIRTYEIERGVIDHALVFSTDVACPTVFRFPATKTDGWNNAGIMPCLPEGARVQLDPAINIAALPGLTKAERVVATALQKYGAYNIDNGGARVALIVETPYDKPNPYPAAGWAADYGQLNLPWDKLRVLSDWNGGGGTTPKPTPIATPTVTPAPTRDVSAPTAPATLAVSARTTSSISLTWAAAKDNVGVTGYVVWRGDANYQNWTALKTLTSASHTFTDLTARAGATYVYAVRAVDKAGNISPPSPTVTS